MTDMQKCSSKHSAELKNAAHLMSQVINVTSANNLNNSLVAPTIISTNSNSNGNLESTGIESSTDLTELNGKMDQLIGMFLLTLFLALFYNSTDQGVFLKVIAE